MSNATTIRAAEVGKEGAAIPAAAKAGKAAAEVEIEPFKSDALKLEEMCNNRYKVRAAKADSRPEQYDQRPDIWSPLYNEHLAIDDTIVLSPKNGAPSSRSSTLRPTM